MRFPFSVALLVFFLSGCMSSPKNTYYTLSVVPVSPVTSTSQAMRVMVGPISLPNMVDQPQLVVQSSDNEVKLYEYHRWAGSLKSDVARVIVANLARELGTSNVWSFSQTTQTNFDYQVLIDVQNLESKLGDSVVLDVLWTIKPKTSLADKSGNAQVKMGRSLMRVPVTGPGIEALVAAQSKAFALVSADITKDMRQ
jgi:uncharacterized lipoprotein YmbA